MNFINRALKNVTRRMSKSVLLAVTFFLIGNLVIIGLGINNAASSAKTLTRQKMRAVVTYEIDYRKFSDYTQGLESEEERQKAYQNYPQITAEDIKNIENDSRVKVINNFYASQGFMVDGLESVPLDNEREQSGNDSNGTMQLNDGTEVVYKEPDVKIQANSYPDMIELHEKMYEVLEGRFYTQEDIDNVKPVVLVTKELAELNNIRVGDTISIGMMNDAQLQNYSGTITADDIKLSLEVIGIFKNAQELDRNAPEFSWMGRYESPYNIMLMPKATFLEKQFEIGVKTFEYEKAQNPDIYKDIEAPNRDNMESTNQMTILLNDPLNVDKFVEEHTANLGDYQKLDANNDTFKKLARPLDTLSLFSNIIVWIVTINAIVIITLITALTLKTREYEIGVLLSMGVSKAKIVAQFFVELVVVALIGFTLAVGSGSLIAKQVGVAVLNYQVDTENAYSAEDENNMNSGYYWGEASYFTDVSQEDLMSQYEVSINPLIIAEIYIMGLGVVFISILIPSFMIMRFNPKRILLNQN